MISWPLWFVVGGDEVQPGAVTARARPGGGDLAAGRGRCRPLAAEVLTCGLDASSRRRRVACGQRRRVPAVIRCPDGRRCRHARPRGVVPRSSRRGAVDVAGRLGTVTIAGSGRVERLRARDHPGSSAGGAPSGQPGPGERWLQPPSRRRWSVISNQLVRVASTGHGSRDSAAYQRSPSTATGRRLARPVLPDQLRAGRRGRRRGPRPAGPRARRAAVPDVVGEVPLGQLPHPGLHAAPGRRRGRAAGSRSPGAWRPPS